MNRIDETLAQLKRENRKALVTYIVCGDPTIDATLDAMNTLVESGADIIELGVPFSDPMAEGLVIQKAHERALAVGTSLTATLATVAKFRRQNQRTPVVLMGYANPVERMGYEKFASAASEAGVDGLLTVDLPPEEAGELDLKLKESGLANIFLIAPTTAESRVKEICSAARGFVYYVSFKGVTGADKLDFDSVQKNTAQICAYAHTPVMVGFGIKDAESAKTIAQFADGVVVGSALVKILGQADKDFSARLQELGELVAPMRAALNSI